MKPISTLSLISVCAAASLLIVSCGEQTPSEQAAPAQTKAMAETAQPVELKMTSAFPLSLTLIGVAGPEFADIVKRASGGRIQEGSGAYSAIFAENVANATLPAKSLLTP